MTEPLIRLLDAVHIDDDRQYIEFRFKGGLGEAHAIQISFEYVEALAALFQQAFISASLEAYQGANRPIGRQWLSVPRVDIDHPVSVGVDVLTERVVAMFLLGSPFQVSYALPADRARLLASDLVSACDEVRHNNAIRRAMN